jgi:small basic protein
MNGSALRRTGAVAELARFGAAAAVNTAFGYGTYAALLWLGLNPYLAQIVSQVLGTVFNSRTYAVAFRSRAAFHRFLLAYVGNYFVNLALLFLFNHLVPSPYLAGLLALGGAAAVNFLILKRLVFRPAAAA